MFGWSLLSVVLLRGCLLTLYRPKTVAVQTVSVMVPLDPEVTIGDTNVAVLVAQGSAGKREGRRFVQLLINSSD